MPRWYRQKKNRLTRDQLIDQVSKYKYLDYKITQNIVNALIYGNI